MKSQFHRFQNEWRTEVTNFLKREGKAADCADCGTRRGRDRFHTVPIFYWAPNEFIKGNMEIRAHQAYPQRLLISNVVRKSLGRGWNASLPRVGTYCALETQ